MPLLLSTDEGNGIFTFYQYLLSIGKRGSKQINVPTLLQLQLFTEVGHRRRKITYRQVGLVYTRQNDFNSFLPNPDTAITRKQRPGKSISVSEVYR